MGRAPNCRPECVINEGCPGNMACQNEQCVDPCPGSCGVNTYCNVIKHNPVCICNNGYTGNPFTECTPIVEGIIDKTVFYKLLLLLFNYIINIVVILVCVITCF